MVISFTPEQEARLAESAQADGIGPESLVTDIVLEDLDFDEQDEVVLAERRRQFNLGVFIDEDEMDRRVQQMLLA